MKTAPLPGPLQVRLLPHRPASPVAHTAVEAVLGRAHEPAIIQYVLTLEPDGTIHYIPAAICRGYLIEPSAPVIVRHAGDPPPSSPARHRAALAAYQATLEAAGYRCAIYGTAWSTYLVVLAGPESEATP